MSSLSKGVVISLACAFVVLGLLFGWIFREEFFRLVGRRRRRPGAPWHFFAVDKYAAYGPLLNVSLAELNERHASQMSTLHSFIDANRCQHIYLDMGSNIGVQIRKLYQPESYPNAVALPVFSKYFNGSSRHNVCAVGFEANAVQTSRLLALQESYRSANFPCVIFTSSAISNRNGTIDFYFDETSPPQFNQWGASAVPWQNGPANKMTALSVHLNAFLHDLHKRWRHTSAFSDLSRLVAKMDIEGSEYDVLPDLLLHGGLCFFDVIMIEWHHRFVPSAPNELNDKILSYLASKVDNCKFKIVDVDDETYGNDNGTPFPLAVNTSTAHTLRRVR